MFTGKDSRLRKRKRLPGGRIKKPIFVYIYILYIYLSLLTLLRNLSEEKEILNLLIYEATAGNFTIEFDSHLYPSITPAQF